MEFSGILDGQVVQPKIQLKIMYIILYKIILNNNLKGLVRGTIVLITIFILEIPLIYLVNNYLQFMLGK